MGMTAAQRARMIDRFRARSTKAKHESLEHRLCACITLALCYGGSVRTINRVSHDIKQRKTST